MGKRQKSMSPSKKKSMIKRENEEKKEIVSKNTKLIVTEKQEMIVVTPRQEMIGPNDEVENWEIHQDQTEEDRPQTRPPHVDPIKDEDVKVVQPETKDVEDYAMSNDDKNVSNA